MLLLSEECILLIIGIMLLRFRNKISYIGEIALVGFISVPALYFIPGNSDDLYRYFLEMNTIKSSDSIHSLFMVYKIVPWLSQHKTNYVFDVIQWLISRNGNYALLAFSAAFIVYFCIFTPFVHQTIVNKLNLEKLFFGLFLVASLFPYDNVISTIRWNIAVATFFIIVYISFNYKHPVLTIPLYVIPLGIHEGVLLPILLVIICMLFKNIHITKYMYLISAVLAFAILFVASHVIKIFNYYNSTGFSVFLGTRFMTISFWLTWIISYIYAFMGFILMKDNKQIINFNLEKEMTNFSIMLDILLMPFSFTMANRYALIVSLCGIFTYLKTMKFHGHIRLYVKLIYLFSIIILFVIMIYALLKEDYNFSQINFSGIFNMVE